MRVLDYQLSRIRFRAVHRWLGRRHQRSRVPRLWCLPGDYIGDEIIANGIYEGDELRALFDDDVLGARTDLAESSVLDVGANIGNHSVWFARYFGEVHSFEPNNTVLPILEANVLINGAANVTIHRLGLGDTAGTHRFAENVTGNLGGSGLVAAGDAVATSGAGLKYVAVDRGDSVLKDVLRLPVRLVKVDAEGHELGVLTGLEQVLRKNMPVIWFESNTQRDGMAVLSFVRGLGYAHCYSMESASARHTHGRASVVRAIVQALLGTKPGLREVDVIDDRPYPMLLASPRPLRTGIPARRG